MSDRDLGLPEAASGGAFIVPEPPGRDQFKPLASQEKVWIWGLAAVCVVAAGIVLHEVVAAALTPEPTGIGFRIERQGSDLLLLWDATKPAMRRATRGVLAISDGSYRKQLDLDAGQLRTGRVFYSADTGDVLVQLDVIDGSGRHVSESARVVGLARKAEDVPVQSASIAPVQPEPVAEQPPEAPPAPKVKPALRPAAARVPPPVTKPVVESPPALAPPPVTKPAVQPAAPAPAPLVKEAVNLAPQRPVVRTPPEEPAKQSPPELPPSGPPRAPAAQPAASATVAGVPGYVGPRVIQRVNPTVPPAMRVFLRRDEVVRLLVSLDASGKVVDARPASGNTALAKLAANALDQWQFEPAKLNGSNVPGDMTLVFNFHTATK
jgi:outer membrane biosynthesis protein TonB